MTSRRPPEALLAWEAQSVRLGYSAEVVGGGDLPSQIARLIGQALRDAKDCGRDRNDVARAMGEYLGRVVTKDHLDKWASEATDSRRIPLDAFIALVAATEELRLLAFVPQRFGCAVVADHYADLIELQELQEHKNEIAYRESVILARVKGKRR